ncbi:hypothetical protein SAMN02745121_03330 [Nannocystis exedens]|uniref:Thioredoxin domain-containing protein n=1 Tax=Nannocystis exedens TaxID=54 RepID=A0A1I1YK71_9BACT|nr:hypothetical protein [Nannocystis exedens]PCC70341.1 hypothetical protein NAEX_03384 [Nannocystis exedens]SFE19428.1 hypothetical protein SAMN02745121_03330 [Nannocystis exedens]
MSADRTRLYLGWSAINLVFTGLGLIITLWVMDRRTDQHEQFVRLYAERRNACTPAEFTEEPATVKLVQAPPRQDSAKSGYLGASGMDISPAMRLNLEALPPGEAGKLPLDTLRLGSPQVLPPRTIHVVNLWATWCDPCLAELPEFKSMFTRHREWDDVRFVPIQIKDHTDPLRSYHDYAGVMPPAPIRLADRTMSDALASTLAVGDRGGLYRGNLPVTLVLDCNRRVRWAKFEQLGEADFAALEPIIDQLRAELADTRPGAWCTLEWPGNGRCEAIERTAAHHSFEDCGPLRRRSSDLPGTAEVVEPEPAASVAVTSPEVLPTTCPPKTQLRNGKCSRLQKLPELQVTAPASSPMCGNGVCDPHESRTTCCQDCPCADRFVCKSLRPREPPRCRAALQP